MPKGGAGAPTGPAWARQRRAEACGQIIIETDSEIIRRLKDDDLTPRRTMEDILKVEEGHADDLAACWKARQARSSQASARGSIERASRIFRRRVAQLVRALP